MKMTEKNEICDLLKEHLKMDELPPALLIFQDGVPVLPPQIPGIEYHYNHDSFFFNILPDKLKSPFFLVHLFRTQETETENQIRNIVTIEKGTTEKDTLTFVEVYLHTDTFESCNTASTELTLNENASLHHIQIQQGNRKGCQHLNTEIKQDANSHYEGGFFAFDILNLQATVWLGLHHNHAKANLKALLFAKRNESSTFNLTVLHQEPLCESNTLVRGVINDQAKGEFSGKIIIEENASRSIARLENKNLLVSQHAEMVTRPQLEVFNDDVQCTHGATVGHLDLQALFYLMSRGIPEENAKKMLMESFVSPTFGSLPSFLLPYIEASLHAN